MIFQRNDLPISKLTRYDGCSNSSRQDFQDSKFEPNHNAQATKLHNEVQCKCARKSATSLCTGKFVYCDVIFGADNMTDLR